MAGATVLQVANDGPIALVAPPRQSSMPITVGGNKCGVLRRRTTRKRYPLLTGNISRCARLAVGRPPSARARLRTLWPSRAARRAQGISTPGSNRSANIRRPHCIASQLNERTSITNRTAWRSLEGPRQAPSVTNTGNQLARTLLSSIVVGIRHSWKSRPATVHNQNLALPRRRVPEPKITVDKVLLLQKARDASRRDEFGTCLCNSHSNRLLNHAGGPPPPGREPDKCDQCPASDGRYKPQRYGRPECPPAIGQILPHGFNRIRYVCLGRSLHSWRPETASYRLNGQCGRRRSRPRSV